MVSPTCHDADADFASAADETRIRTMFDRIAERYDLMNAVMTAGLDRRWRSAAARATGLRPGDNSIDVCCGTGDLTIACARLVGPGGSVVGLDFSREMLDRAQRKIDAAGAAARLVQGNALALPFPDGTFDAATIGFGARNLADLEAGFAEMARVTRAGGRVVCLEVTSPGRRASRAFHRVWFDGVVPRLGSVVSDGQAYAYLPASVKRFPAAEELGALMARSGMTDVAYSLYGGGIVAIHVGVVNRGA